MEDNTAKIQRSVNLIKGFMVLFVLVQVVNIYQSGEMDWGSLAGTFGVLSLFRGLLLSPKVFTSPMRYWLKNNFLLSTASYKYFLFALVLIIISLF